MGLTASLSNTIKRVSFCNFIEFILFVVLFQFNYFFIAQYCKLQISLRGLYSHCTHAATSVPKPAHQHRKTFLMTEIIQILRVGVRQDTAGTTWNTCCYFLFVSCQHLQQTLFVLAPVPFGRSPSHLTCDSWIGSRGFPSVPGWCRPWYQCHSLPTPRPGRTLWRLSHPSSSVCWPVEEQTAAMKDQSVGN